MDGLDNWDWINVYPMQIVFREKQNANDVMMMSWGWGDNGIAYDK